MSKHTIAPTDVFRLKPFKWVYTNSSYHESYAVGNSMGLYHVERWKPESAEWGPWRVTYCYDEYYDEGAFEITSPDEGKAWCWDDWCVRIRPHLIAHKPRQ